MANEFIYTTEIVEGEVHKTTFLRLGTEYSHYNITVTENGEIEIQKSCRKSEPLIITPLVSNVITIK